MRSRVDSGTPPGPVYTFDGHPPDERPHRRGRGLLLPGDTAGGPYCLVHPRKPGALNYDATHEGNYGSGQVPACPMYAETLARQAGQLIAAGVDFIVTDQTNIADFSAFGDAIQLRPFEVVLEEWRKLRQAGREDARRRRLAADGAAPGRCCPHVLAVYNAPRERGDDPPSRRQDREEDPLLSRRRPTSIMTLVAPVASNGGKNDIVPVPMWVDRQAPGLVVVLRRVPAGRADRRRPLRARRRPPRSVVGLAARGLAELPAQLREPAVPGAGRVPRHHPSQAVRDGVRGAGRTGSSCRAGTSTSPSPSPTRRA